MRSSKTFIAAVAVTCLVAAACSDDDGESSSETSSAEAPSAEGPSAEVPSTDSTTTEAPSTEAAAALDLDTNGDGTVVFGIAAAGPRDDGGYYQALVDKAIAVSEANGYGQPIVVDNITTEDAATQLANLAVQSVDTIFVGDSAIADPLTDLIAQYPHIFWYCNCGPGHSENPGLAQSKDDSSEISYSAGYATGLLLQEAGGDSVAFIGCCDLNFEKEAYLAYELGLKAVDESFTMTYSKTGAFPFDFDNTAAATEALNGAITNGADAVYPYLDGAHVPLVNIANEEGLITMSAGSSKACARTDLDYQIQVKFDPGDYIDSILQEITGGTFHEGEVRVFRVGVDREPGAEICDPTPDQEAAMEELYAQIADGDLVDTFDAIKGQANSGG